ncbi:MAG: aspartate--ammonia ligase [Desulfurococcales archaeon]|nr:aspartate--ammonia ligase [Desulfurococcales archaeon]
MRNHHIVGWVEKLDRRSSTLLIRERGVLRKVKLSKDAEVRGDLTDGGREVLVKVLAAGENGSLTARYVEVLHTSGKVDEGSLNPSDPERFARASWRALKLPKYQKVVAVQHALLKYFREFLDSEGFTELLPPMISTASDPGLRGASKLRTKLYGVEYELTSSTIMFKQVAATSLGKIYFVARNVREEPPEHIVTGRHLVEFTQLDIEWAGATMEDVMDLAERMIEYACRRIVRNYGQIVKEFRRGGFSCWDLPLRRVPYTEALEIARSLGTYVEEGKELSQEAEEAVSLAIGRPFWVTHYPAGSRSFYYLPDASDPSRNKDFNLILPQGYGEVIDGGEREYRYERIVERLKALGEDLTKYRWFLEAVKEGIAPSAGFGLGIERFTRYLLGLKYVWEAVPFPKPPGVTHTP